MCEGKGSLSHNNREFTAKNIDPSRTADNIVFVQQELGEAYHHLFDEAVEKYNARQKRNDRKIDDYFEHLFNRPPGKSFIVNSNKHQRFGVVTLGRHSIHAREAVAHRREYRSPSHRNVR